MTGVGGANFGTPHGAAPDEYLDGLEEVPSHRNDLGDGCPRSGERTTGGTCPLGCHEADVLTGFDAGDRGLPESTDLPRELWPPYHLASQPEIAPEG